MPENIEPKPVSQPEENVEVAEAPVPEVSEEKTIASLEGRIEDISVAPRVTKEYMKSRCAHYEFINHGLLTICIIKVDNGFTVTGESACVNEANYNQTIGEEIAYDNAFDKLWPLFGFVLAETGKLK